MSETPDTNEAADGQSRLTAGLGNNQSDDEKTFFEMKVTWRADMGYGFVTAHKNGKIDQTVLARSPAHAGQILRDIIEGYKPTKFFVFCRTQQLEQTQPERELDYVVSNARIQAPESQPSDSCHTRGVAL